MRRGRLIPSLFFLLWLVSGCVRLGAGDSGAELSSTVCSVQERDAVRPPPRLPKVSSESKLDRDSLRFLGRRKTSLPGVDLPFPNSMIKRSEIPLGSALSVLVDHECTRNRDDGLSSEDSKIAFLSRELLTPSIEALWRSKGAKLRAHTWVLTESLDAEALERLAQVDDCVVTVSAEIENVTSGSVFDDPLLPQQTHLETIRAADAEAVFFDSVSGINGETVVALIDDGIRLNHPDLAPNLWINAGETPGNGIDDDGNGYVDDINGWNFASNLPSPAHESAAGHGTHVAGLVAARAGNGTGGAGVIGRNVRIMALNVFGASESATTSTLANAVRYAVRNGAHVINLSLGGRGRSIILENAIAEAVAAGVTVFAAAGNDGEEININFTPAGYARDIDGLISVGSTDVSSGRLSTFSNFSGSLVELAAPGSESGKGGLLSTTADGNYGMKQGTSMSTPLAAGAGALIIGLARTRGLTLAPARIEDLLLKGSPAVPALDGRIRGCRALDLGSLAELLATSLSP